MPCVSLASDLKNSTQPPHKRSIKLTRAVPTDPRQLAAFSSFYAAYPRHVDRADAEKAWLEINPDPELTARIMSTVQAYADSVEDVEPRFIKHPGSWLRKKRWEDELPGNGNGQAKPAIVQPKDIGNGLVEVDGLKMTTKDYERKYGSRV